MVIRERERLIYNVNTEKCVPELIDEQSPLEIGLSVTRRLSGDITVLILSKRERGKKITFIRTLSFLQPEPKRIRTVSTGVGATVGCLHGQVHVPGHLETLYRRVSGALRI